MMFKREIVNVKILQHVFVVETIGYNKYTIRDARWWKQKEEFSISLICDEGYSLGKWYQDMCWQLKELNV